MALQYFKVINAATKEQIDLLYGWDRLDVLKKVERKMNDYRYYCKANTVALVPATDEELARYHGKSQSMIDEVYKTAGTAD